MRISLESHFAYKGKDIMKVLVIPDIHLKSWLFDRAETIMKAGKTDRSVCLMDMPDDWDMEFQIERYKETFDRAIAFAVSYPDTLWCYGNHDVSYPWGRLETGYSPYAERTVMTKLEELENSLREPSQINIMHRIDNALFSYGGLTVEFLKWLNEDLLNADIDDVITAVNDASHDYLWNDESPLWFRPQNKDREIFRADTYKQVVGHTPVERIYKKIGYELCVNMDGEKQKANAIYDIENYADIYWRDLEEAKRAVIVSSPRLNNQKVNRIISALGNRQKLGVKVTIVTWHPDSYKYGRDDVRMELMERLRKSGFEIKLVEESCEHFAVIDNEIVWYGSMNLLSKEDAEDNLMRVCSKDIAAELLEMTFGTEADMQEW